METVRAHFTHRAGAFTLDASLEVPARGITGVYGASGAGKSTLLRCMAGLTRAEQASFHVGGSVLHDSQRGVFVPAHQRAIGYVGQRPALFPHLDVRANLRYGLRRTPVEQRSVSEDDVIAWLGIEQLLARRPETLSGGEAQRVAIARALLAGPRMLLLDEPVSALDEAGRAEILPCLARLHRELTMPVFLVTHALHEIARFADTIVHLVRGRVAAQGPLTAMLPQLGTPGDALAVLTGTVHAVDTAHHLMAVSTAFGDLQCVLAAREGESVRLLIAAREVSLGRAVDAHSSILNQVPAVVESLCDAAPGQLLITLRPLQASEACLLALITTRSREHLSLAAGQQIFARIKGVNVGAA